MDSEDSRDHELAARLRRLDAGGASVTPGFDYDRMLERHAAKKLRERRSHVAARGAAVALLVVLVGASVWRLDVRVAKPVAEIDSPEVPAPALQPRIVRADTYMAVAALEDHIAGLDDALNYARASGGATDVARLERTRAELLASYTQLRYAERVSATF
jgi:hypothetical protein